MKIKTIFPIAVFVGIIAWILGTATMFGFASEMLHCDATAEKAFALRYVQLIVMESFGMLGVLLGATMAWKIMSQDPDKNMQWFPIVSSLLLVVAGAVLISLACWKGISVNMIEDIPVCSVGCCEPC